MVDLPNRIHIVGAGGSGMSGLAKLLAQSGRIVTGSDLRPSPAFAELVDLGVEVWTGHHPEALGPAELVVASSAIPENDPEVASAVERGIPVWRRPDLLAALTTEMPAIGVTGTHGKTTSTALAVTAVQAAGRDPSFLLGGRMLSLRTGAHLGERDLFLLEADEAFGTFLRLNLRALLVTNIEADHLDHYGSMEAVAEAFLEVAEGTRGPVVACYDDPGSRDLVDRVGAVTYGVDPAAEWVLSEIRSHGPEVRFRLQGHGSDAEVVVPTPGRHVALNAAGVVALLAELGFDPADVAAGLAGFGGVRRRFEVRGSIGGVEVIDDYAHHPTEIAATIAAARSRHSGRVVAAFQPHRYSRTEEHGPGFGEALASADVVFVTDVYAAGEAPIPGITGALVVGSVESAGTDVRYIPHRSELAAAVAEEIAAGDLLLTLGAGDITGLATELVELGER